MDDVMSERSDSGFVNQGAQGQAVQSGTMDPERPGLCEQCRKIPLQYRKLEKLKSEDNTWLLGTLGEVRSMNCPLCQLVASLCYKMIHSTEPLVKQDDSSEVLLAWEKECKSFRSELFPFGTYICFTQADHISLCHVKSELPEWIDPNECRRWLERCEDHHDYKCHNLIFNKQELRMNDGRAFNLRLIDIRNMCIVDAPDRCRYVALSYVWGDPDDGRLVLNRFNQYSLREAQGLRNYWHIIPLTIASAIKWLHSFGERYLWVDSLCLVQDEEDEMSASIEVMDAYYAMACFTIIAGSGINAYAGLRGVRPIPRGSV